MESQGHHPMHAEGLEHPRRSHTVSHVSQQAAEPGPVKLYPGTALHQSINGSWQEGLSPICGVPTVPLTTLGERTDPPAVPACGC